MRQSRKSKTEKSPGQELRLYRSTQLKEPYHLSGKHSIVRDSQVKGQATSKSMWMKCGNRSTQGRKSQRAIEGSMDNSKQQCQHPYTPMHKHTQATNMGSQSRQTHYRIEDLLGLHSEMVSKKASLVVESSQPTQQISRCNEEQDEELDRLRAQNKELMRVNQLLLYEKEYFKQKTILQEVEIRELSRKMQSMEKAKGKRNHHKNKSETQEPDLTFKFRGGAEPGQGESEWLTEAKQTKLINLASRTQKSSLLVSESQSQLMPLQSKENKENVEWGAESNSQVRRTEKEFSELLESVQNESNLNRKTTLRKMLAIKAMELKKVKQRY